MSDLLNSASLVMVPSGYKEDTVYSVVPSDGSGDMAFTRASNGTRVNSAGLVEVCPWNILQYSEDLSNGVWLNTSTTVTSNNTTAPNGTLTADKLEFTNNVAYYYQPNIGTNSSTGCISVYLKADANTQIYIASNDLVNWGTGVQLLCNVTTEWQRFEIGGVASNVNGFKSWLIGTINPTNGGSGLSARTIYAWGAQVNIGSTAKPYFPTTDRLNVPRLTYQNGGGGCPSLLLEKQSTNLITYSEQIQNADWNVIGGDLVVTGNATTSPDGTQNAGAITLANSANRYFVHNLFSITGGVTYTYSVYMKSASGTLQINMGGVNGLAGVLKTVTTEWQRFTYTFTPATTYAEYFGFDNRGAGSSTSGTLYFWGAQVEASSYATSLINTTSSSATRVADACSKTGISSLIGQTEGVAFIDFDFNGNYSSGGIIPFSLDGGAGSELYAWIQTNGTVIFEVYNSFVGQVVITGSIGAVGRKKIAFAYKQNDFAVYLNGTQVGTDTSGTVPTMSRLFVGRYYANETYNINAGINQAVLFPTRLSNSELASLTTI